MKVHDADNGFITLDPWELEALAMLQRILGNKPYYVVGDTKFIMDADGPPMTDIRFVHGSEDI